MGSVHLPASLSAECLDEIGMLWWGLVGVCYAGDDRDVRWRYGAWEYWRECQPDDGGKILAARC